MGGNWRTKDVRTWFSGVLGYIKNKATVLSLVLRNIRTVLKGELLLLYFLSLVHFYDFMSRIEA